MRHHLLFIAALLLSVFGCRTRPPARAASEIDPDMLKNVAATPWRIDADTNPYSKAKADLGRALYYDKRLSKGGDISCNTCHPLDRFGVDNHPVSIGHLGHKGTRNAPSVYFAAGHVVQFWDGRAPTIEEQAKGPLLNPSEMAMEPKEVEQVLRANYVPGFQKAFPQEKTPLTLQNAAFAIAVFERGLTTPSRWDQFLQGAADALNAEEKAGFMAFHQAGCIACHNGPYLGGRLYTKVGIVKAWPSQNDLGRFLVSGLDYQRMTFKVPSLRNVEKTAPYFHDGSVAKLEDAVTMMGEHQVERALTVTEIKSIVAWMKSLTGTIPVDYITPPR